MHCLHLTRAEDILVVIYDIDDLNCDLLLVAKQFDGQSTWLCPEPFDYWGAVIAND